jgi:hypothetical protein
MLSNCERRGTNVSEPEAEMDAIIENSIMESLRDYVQRGRGLSHLTDTDLADAWVAQMNLWGDQAANYSERACMDCAAEMSLRKIDPPFDRAGDAFAKIRARSLASMRAIRKNPRKTAIMENGLANQFQELRQCSKKPKN